MNIEPQVGCPSCGKPMRFARSKQMPSGSRKCIDCDGDDPLTSTEVQGWLNSELGRSNQPKK